MSIGDWGIPLFFFLLLSFSSFNILWFFLENYSERSIFKKMKSYTISKWEPFDWPILVLVLRKLFWKKKKTVLRVWLYGLILWKLKAEVEVVRWLESLKLKFVCFQPINTLYWSTTQFTLNEPIVCHFLIWKQKRQFRVVCQHVTSVLA